VDALLAETLLASGEPIQTPLGEHLTEHCRLIAKRLFTLIVDDDQVNEVVQIIIDANQTGHPGDGKIFVIPIREAYTVRTGEATKEAY